MQICSSQSQILHPESIGFILADTEIMHVLPIKS